MNGLRIVKTMREQHVNNSITIRIMIKKYIRDSIQELNNVTWPTRKQAIRITTIVFIFMIVAAAVLGVVDQFLSIGYKALLKI